MNVKKAIKKLQEWVGIIDSEYLTECDWSIASEHLNKRINEQEDRLASLKEELRSVEAKVRPLDIDVSSMRCAIEKVCSRINSTLGADKAAITKVEECEQLCEDTRMRLDVLKDELHSLQNKIPEGAGALSGSTAESVQNLSTQFETAIERINHSFDALYQRVATLEASSKEKATDLKAMQDNARAWDNTISKRLGFIETKQKVHHKDITEIQGALTTLRDETVQEVLTISGKVGWTLLRQSKG
jgi:chromosome segregation ATPase